MLSSAHVREGREASKAAAAFFEIVDGALTLLAEAEGWKFMRKPTCARLVISKDAHIDVPLYAIPNREFRTLDEAAQARTHVVKDMGIRVLVDRCDALPSNCVLLARREDD